MDYLIVNLFFLRKILPTENSRNIKRNGAFVVLKLLIAILYETTFKPTPNKKCKYKLVN